MNSISDSQEKYLKDYQAPPFQIPTTELFFELYADFCLVKTKLKVRRCSSERDLTLEGKDLKLIQIKLDGSPVTSAGYSLFPESLTLHAVPDEFWLETVVQIKPQENTFLEGLYVSQGIYCTQCEAEGFRRITYFLDRPDVLSQFSVTIEADKNLFPVLLSNGNQVSAEQISQRRHRVQWHDPFPKPCYLFALVAGSLEWVTDRYQTLSGKQVDLFVYARPGLQKKSIYALDCLKRAMLWEEKTFGLEYDLNSYMIVAIDDFNAGAMENKGLNIFNSRLVLADPDSASVDDYESIDSVIAHEYLHNWSGNRITLKNWFQLSLKEGLTVFRDQEYTSDYFSRAVKRIEDVAQLKSRQFPEDEGPTAHPVRPESFMTIDNFFTPTIYEKGAEVLRVLQSILGTDVFRKGLKHYFQKHDGQAVGVEDFLICMEETAKVRLSQFFLWYSQAGLPQLEVSWKYINDLQELEVNFVQSHLPSPGQEEKKPMILPIDFSWLTKEGQLAHPRMADCFVENADSTHKNKEGLSLFHEKHDSLVFNLSQTSQRLKIKNVSSFQTMTLLRGLSCPVKLKANYSEEDLFFLFAHDSDPYNRWESGQMIYFKAILGLLKQLEEQHPLSISQSLLQAFKELLKSEPFDPAYKSLLVTPPSDALLVQQLDKVQTFSLALVREAFRHQIAKHTEENLRSWYERLAAVPLDMRQPHTFGIVRLKNQLLSYLGHIDLNVVWKQFKNSQNMTDQERALQILGKFESDLFLEASNAFYQRWQDDALVLNKWFSATALSHRKDTFSRIQQMLRHPKFNLQNPNNVYSLLRSFGRENVLVFHNPELETYEIYGNIVGQVDEKNPLVASRLMEVFQTISKFPLNHAQRFHKVAEELLSRPKISKNLREILQKMTVSTPEKA